MKLWHILAISRRGKGGKGDEEKGTGKGDRQEKGTDLFFSASEWRGVENKSVPFLIMPSSWDVIWVR
ncbi:hypothetical protein [Pseudomonas putida]|uniref:hypothetical protein n=1 Tax=Pseudomonas putida TaxID=303 RepID=UPI00119827C6|nr:hypothetical protein [Pseudomonas putida]